MNNIDNLFKSSLGEYAETPPPAVWDALERRLDEGKKRRVFPFRWLWFFTLISFIVLIGTSLAWKTMDESHPVSATNSVPVSPATAATGQPATMVPAHTATGQPSAVTAPAAHHHRTVQHKLAATPAATTNAQVPQVIKATVPAAVPQQSATAVSTADVPAGNETAATIAPSKPVDMTTGRRRHNNIMVEDTHPADEAVASVPAQATPATTTDANARASKNVMMHAYAPETNRTVSHIAEVGPEIPETYHEPISQPGRPATAGIASHPANVHPVPVSTTGKKSSSVAVAATRHDKANGRSRIRHNAPADMPVASSAYASGKPVSHKAIAKHHPDKPVTGTTNEPAIATAIPAPVATTGVGDHTPGASTGEKKARGKLSAARPIAAPTPTAATQGSIPVLATENVNTGKKKAATIKPVPAAVAAGAKINDAATAGATVSASTPVLPRTTKKAKGAGTKEITGQPENNSLTPATSTTNDAASVVATAKPSHSHIRKAHTSSLKPAATVVATNAPATAGIPDAKPATQGNAAKISGTHVRKANTSPIKQGSVSVAANAPSAVAVPGVPPVPQDSSAIAARHSKGRGKHSSSSVHRPAASVAAATSATMATATPAAPGKVAIPYNNVTKRHPASIPATEGAATATHKAKQGQQPHTTDVASAAPRKDAVPLPATVKHDKKHAAPVNGPDNKATAVKHKKEKENIPAASVAVRKAATTTSKTAKTPKAQVNGTGSGSLSGMQVTASRIRKPAAHAKGIGKQSAPAAASPVVIAANHKSPFCNYAFNASEDEPEIDDRLIVASQKTDAGKQEDAILPGTFKPEVAAPKAATPDSTVTVAAADSSKRSFLSRLGWGIKGGIESGFGAGTAKKGVFSTYVAYNIAPRWSVMLQPAIKVANVGGHSLSGSQSFYKANGDSSLTVTDSIPVFIIGTGGHNDTIGWGTTYRYSRSHDSIVKSYSVGGTYIEMEMPLLLKFKINSHLSVYGGPNFCYGRYVATKEKTATINVMASKTATQINPIGTAPTPAPIDSILRLSGTPYTQYGGPLYPNSTSSLLRIGYMLGFSYEFNKRWMVDVLMQQTPTQTRTVGGYNANTALSAPYFRFTLGYQLKK